MRENTLQVNYKKTVNIFKINSHYPEYHKKRIFSVSKMQQFATRLTLWYIGLVQ
jgi:hypothetical protein